MFSMIQVVKNWSNWENRVGWQQVVAPSLTSCQAETSAAGEETALEETSEWNPWRQNKKIMQ